MKPYLSCGVHTGDTWLRSFEENREASGHSARKEEESVISHWEETSRELIVVDNR